MSMSRSNSSHLSPSSSSSPSKASTPSKSTPSPPVPTEKFGIKFHERDICKVDFEVNLDEKELNVLTNFDELIPKIDKDGIYLELKNGTVVSLNSLINQWFVKDSKNLDDTAYERKIFDINEATMKKVVSQSYNNGFQTPSAPQAVSVLPIIEGRDVVVQSKSGTGKTFGFISATACLFNSEDPALQIIIMSSTHDIATQIYEEIIKSYDPSIKISLCIGHKPEQLGRQTGGFRTSNVTKKKTRAELKAEFESAQIIVGTIGKIYDCMINLKYINPSYLRAFCVDEFDAIVSTKGRGGTFSSEQQMKEIIKHIPDVEVVKIDDKEKINTGCQRLFFSATITDSSFNTALSYFRKEHPKIKDPLICLLNEGDLLLEGIKQYFVEVTNTRDKMDMLYTIIKQTRISQCFIFVNTKEDAVYIKRELSENGITAAAFNSNLSSSERNDLLDKFRTQEFRYLISSDVLARGIDVHSVNLVINFDMSNDLETHIHRIGRAGRYGRKGTAINFILTNDSEGINEMEKVQHINSLGDSYKMIPLPKDISKLLD